jgi:hypothetical protein
MGYEFTVEEIQEVIHATRVYSPGFSEEQLQALLLVKGRLRESGYLEAVRGLAQLEKEGIPTTQALKENKELLRRNTELELKINNSLIKWKSLEENNYKAEVDLNHLNKTIQQAKKELEELRATWTKEDRELTEFYLDAGKEKENLAQEIDDCRQKSRITQAEVAIAGQIKAEIEAHNFSLELVLKLAQEFGSHEKPCEELALGIEKYQTVGGCIQEQQKVQQVELEKFSAEKERSQTDIKILEASRLGLQNILLRFQADVACEEEIRQFHRRYWNVIGLIECLASWDQVLFLKCHNPLSAMGGFFNPEVKNAHFWTDRKVAICPHCGFNLFNFDEKPYLALGAPVGEPLKIVLGE